jgi:protein phosphatase
MSENTDKFDIGCATSVGMVRAVNEDNYFVSAENGVFGVADGMGGHSKGDVASYLAIEMLKELAPNKDIGMKEMIRAGHRHIVLSATRGLGAKDMGTTLVAARIKDKEYTVSWAGDSRAYLCDDNFIKQVSSDHTYVQELFDSGLITYHEFIHHPQKHLLTSSLGAMSEEQMIISEISGFMGSHDTLCLCSDGVTNEVSDQGLLDIISLTGISNQEKADIIIRKADELGGHDNSTVILISYRNEEFDNFASYDANSITMPIN